VLTRCSVPLPCRLCGWTRHRGHRSGAAHCPYLHHTHTGRYKARFVSVEFVTLCQPQTLPLMCTYMCSPVRRRVLGLVQ
jgi:hypothetical protein